MKKMSTFIKITTIILAIFIGLIVPLALSTRKQPTLVDHTALKASIQKQFSEDLSTAVGEEALKLEKDIAEGAVPDQQVEAAKAKLAALKTGPVLTPAAGVEPGADGDMVSVAAEPAVTDTPAGKQVKDSSVQEKINANRDKISDEDLSAGSAIYNTLDTGYLFGLADGGLTAEENAEVQKYLRANLGDSEYQIAQRLYYNYVGLLNAEA